MGPSTSDRVLRSVAASTSAATRVNSALCAAMSGVPNSERVNILSQCTDTLLRLKGTLRFNELRRRLPNRTQRMLTTQLRELEEDRLRARRVYAGVPPKVEYSLTPRSESLRPVVAALKAWGDANVVLIPAAAAEAGGDGAEAAE